MKIIDVLYSVEWCQKNFGSLSTNRHVRLRDVRKAVALGLVKSIGLVSKVDGDGFIVQPERYAEGYVLTKKGKAMLKKDDESRRSE